MPHIPNHPSAQKRYRQSLKRQVRNRAIKTRVRSATKHAVETIAAGDRNVAEAALRDAMKVLDKAASKGTLKRNTASRKISRLARRLHRAYTAPASAAPAQS
jgi:small subunit ribosomal protein S20